MRGPLRVLGETWPSLIDAPLARSEPLRVGGRGQTSHQGEGLATAPSRQAIQEFGDDEISG
jgi:hypothetical protein